MGADSHGGITMMARRCVDDITVRSPSLQADEVHIAMLVAFGLWVPVQYITKRLKVQPVHKRCWTCRKVGFHSDFRHWRFRSVELERYLRLFLDDPSDAEVHQD